MPTKTRSDLTDLDAHVLLDILARAKAGDFTARAPLHWTGIGGKVADSLNDVMGAAESFEAELANVSARVGAQGDHSQRASFRQEHGYGGALASVNSLIDELVRPTSEMQRVIGAVAAGDLTKKITIDARGDMYALKTTINDMIDRLNDFTSEVTRVAREVGTEGKLGQAALYTLEVGGVWKQLTDNVNLMASNLTKQVRDIAEVTTAVANGDLSKKITADVQGEFLELKNTVNAMVAQLNRFAGEVTRVAREVGVEGRLGGQAESQEVSGVWKDLTDDVNQLAGNLTAQVRAISDVATAVTEGDLTRQVHVAASGEVAVLKDKLNEMIRTLRETMRQNTEQDWLKTNLERFTRMLAGQRDLPTVTSLILSELAPLVSAHHGAFFVLTPSPDEGEQVLHLQAGYGLKERKHLSTVIRLGEGLVGQCALDKQPILLTDVPANYVQISSAIGEAPPLNVIVLPILFESTVRAVIELASFTPFSITHQTFLEQLTESIGLVLNTVATTSVTERLLEQAQSQAEALQSQQEQLRLSNSELADQATAMAEQNAEVRSKYEEMEIGKRLVEETANELALSSRYKSEFIANMSHELRTPLNSLLVLAEQLAANPDGNLSAREVEYATVIRASGLDLLKLLNDVLDLAKVESNNVELEIAPMELSDLRDNLLQVFGPVAAKDGLALAVELAPDAPGSIETDARRVRQIMTNLLANACKFTSEGSVTVRIAADLRPWDGPEARPPAAGPMLAIAVADTGIGIAPERQAAMFEPFTQADGTTSRTFGGTGLGLSISRNLARALGGEITVASVPGVGSTFTIHLPVTFEGRPDHRGDAPVTVAGPAGFGETLAATDADNGDLVLIARPSTNGGKELPSSRATTALPSGGMRGTHDALTTTGRVDALAPTSQHGHSASAGRPIHPDGFSPTALVVDDDLRNLFAMTALLEREHIRVMPAESGPAALALLAGEARVDIILMDIMMPVMDGYATIRAIRGRPDCEGVPIIAVTGKVVPNERERCVAAGASDYMPKPVDAGDLIAAIGHWLPADRKR